MDNITCTILEDGTVRVDTDKISGPNHSNAEAALQFLAKELGGDVHRVSRHPATQHIHEHGHEHSHA